MPGRHHKLDVNAEFCGGVRIFVGRRSAGSCPQHRLEHVPPLVGKLVCVRKLRRGDVFGVAVNVLVDEPHVLEQHRVFALPMLDLHKSMTPEVPNRPSSGRPKRHAQLDQQRLAGGVHVGQVGEVEIGHQPGLAEAAFEQVIDAELSSAGDERHAREDEDGARRDRRERAPGGGPRRCCRALWPRRQPPPPGARRPRRPPHPPRSGC